MKKKLFALLTAFTFIFATLSIASTNVAEAKGYKSGKGSFSPSQNQTITPNKSQNSNIQQTTPSKPSTPAAAPSNKGSLVKGMLLGGIGGLLMGSLFASLGPVGSSLALLINILLFAGVVMLLVKAFQTYRKRREEAWKR